MFKKTKVVEEKKVEKKIVSAFSEKPIVPQSITAVVETEKKLMPCPKCGEEMASLKKNDNERLWECPKCQYKHCLMR